MGSKTEKDFSPKEADYKILRSLRLARWHSIHESITLATPPVFTTLELDRPIKIHLIEPVILFCIFSLSV